MSMIYFLLAFLSFVLCFASNDDSSVPLIESELSESHFLQSNSLDFTTHDLQSRRLEVDYNSFDFALFGGSYAIPATFPDSGTDNVMLGDGPSAIYGNFSGNYYYSNLLTLSTSSDYALELVPEGESETSEAFYYLGLQNMTFDAIGYLYQFVYQLPEHNSIEWHRGCSPFFHNNQVHITLPCDGFWHNVAIFIDYATRHVVVAVDGVLVCDSDVNNEHCLYSGALPVPYGSLGVSPQVRVPPQPEGATSFHSMRVHAMSLAIFEEDSLGILWTEDPRLLVKKASTMSNMRNFDPFLPSPFYVENEYAYQLKWENYNVPIGYSVIEADRFNFNASFSSNYLTRTSLVEYPTPSGYTFLNLYGTCLPIDFSAESDYTLISFAYQVDNADYSAVFGYSTHSLCGPFKSNINIQYPCDNKLHMLTVLFSPNASSVVLIDGILFCGEDGTACIVTGTSFGGEIGPSHCQAANRGMLFSPIGVWSISSAEYAAFFSSSSTRKVADRVYAEDSLRLIRANFEMALPSYIPYDFSLPSIARLAYPESAGEFPLLVGATRDTGQYQLSLAVPPLYRKMVFQRPGSNMKYIDFRVSCGGIALLSPEAYDTALVVFSYAFEDRDQPSPDCSPFSGNFPSYQWACSSSFQTVAIIFRFAGKALSIAIDGATVCDSRISSLAGCGTFTHNSGDPFLYLGSSDCSAEHKKMQFGEIFYRVMVSEYTLSYLTHSAIYFARHLSSIVGNNITDKSVGVLPPSISFPLDFHGFGFATLRFDECPCYDILLLSSSRLASVSSIMAVDDRARLISPKGSSSVYHFMDLRDHCHTIYLHTEANYSLITVEYQYHFVSRSDNCGPFSQNLYNISYPCDNDFHSLALFIDKVHGDAVLVLDGIVLCGSNHSLSCPFDDEHDLDIGAPYDFDYASGDSCLGTYGVLLGQVAILGELYDIRDYFYDMEFSDFLSNLSTTSPVIDFLRSYNFEPPEYTIPLYISPFEPHNSFSWSDFAGSSLPLYLSYFEEHPSSGGLISKEGESSQMFLPIDRSDFLSRRVSLTSSFTELRLEGSCEISFDLVNIDVTPYFLFHVVYRRDNDVSNFPSAECSPLSFDVMLNELLLPCDDHYHSLSVFIDTNHSTVFAALDGAILCDANEGCVYSQPNDLVEAPTIGRGSDCGGPLTYIAKAQFAALSYSQLELFMMGDQSPSGLLRRLSAESIDQKVFLAFSSSYVFLQSAETLDYSLALITSDTTGYEIAGGNVSIRFGSSSERELATFRVNEAFPFLKMRKQCETVSIDPTMKRFLVSFSYIIDNSRLEGSCLPFSLSGMSFDTWCESPGNQYGLNFFSAYVTLSETGELETLYASLNGNPICQYANETSELGCYYLPAEEEMEILIGHPECKPSRGHLWIGAVRFKYWESAEEQNTDLLDFFVPELPSLLTISSIANFNSSLYLDDPRGFNFTANGFLQTRVDYSATGYDATPDDSLVIEFIKIGNTRFSDALVPIPQYSLATAVIDHRSICSPALIYMRNVRRHQLIAFVYRYEPEEGFLETSASQCSPIRHFDFHVNCDRHPHFMILHYDSETSIVTLNYDGVVRNSSLHPEIEGLIPALNYNGSDTPFASLFQTPDCYLGGFQIADLVAYSQESLEFDILDRLQLRLNDTVRELLEDEFYMFPEIHPSPYPINLSRFYNISYDSLSDYPIPSDERVIDTNIEENDFNRLVVSPISEDPSLKIFDFRSHCVSFNISTPDRYIVLVTAFRNSRISQNTETACGPFVYNSEMSIPFPCDDQFHSTALFYDTVLGSGTISLDNMFLCSTDSQERPCSLGFPNLGSEGVLSVGRDILCFQSGVIITKLAVMTSNVLPLYSLFARLPLAGGLAYLTLLSAPGYPLTSHSLGSPPRRVSADEIHFGFSFDNAASFLVTQTYYGSNDMIVVGGESPTRFILPFSELEFATAIIEYNYFFNVLDLASDGCKGFSLSNLNLDVNPYLIIDLSYRRIGDDFANCSPLMMGDLLSSFPFPCDLFIHRMAMFYDHSTGHSVLAIDGELICDTLAAFGQCVRREPSNFLSGAQITVGRHMVQSKCVGPEIAFNEFQAIAYDNERFYTDIMGDRQPYTLLRRLTLQNRNALAGYGGRYGILTRGLLLDYNPSQVSFEEDTAIAEDSENGVIRLSANMRYSRRVFEELRFAFLSETCTGVSILPLSSRFLLSFSYYSGEPEETSHCSPVFMGTVSLPGFCVGGVHHIAIYVDRAEEVIYIANKGEVLCSSPESCPQLSELNFTLPIEIRSSCAPTAYDLLLSPISLISFEAEAASVLSGLAPDELVGIASFEAHNAYRSLEGIAFPPTLDLNDLGFHVTAYGVPTGTFGNLESGLIKYDYETLASAVTESSPPLLDLRGFCGNLSLSSNEHNVSIVAFTYRIDKFSIPYINSSVLCSPFYADAGFSYQAPCDENFHSVVVYQDRSAELTIIYLDDTLICDSADSCSGAALPIGSGTDFLTIGNSHKCDGVGMLIGPVAFRTFEEKPSYVDDPFDFSARLAIEQRRLSKNFEIPEEIPRLTFPNPFDYISAGFTIMNHSTPSLTSISTPDGSVSVSVSLSSLEYEESLLLFASDVDYPEQWILDLRDTCGSVSVDAVAANYLIVSVIYYQNDTASIPGNSFNCGPLSDSNLTPLFPCGDSFHQLVMYEDRVDMHYAMAVDGHIICDSRSPYKSCGSLSSEPFESLYKFGHSSCSTIEDPLNKSDLLLATISAKAFENRPIYPFFGYLYDSNTPIGLLSTQNLMYLEHLNSLVPSFTIPSESPSATSTASVSATSSSSSSSTLSATSSATSTSTVTSTGSSTSTTSSTSTSSATSSSTSSATSTTSSTSSASSSSTSSATSTTSSTSSASSSSTSSATSSASSSSTLSSTRTATSTTTSTATRTRTATSTSSTISTSSGSSSSSATSSATSTSTNSASSSSTTSSTRTATSTTTSTATRTRTATSTSSTISTSSGSSTSSATSTPSISESAFPSESETPSISESPTATSSSSSILSPTRTSSRTNTSTGSSSITASASITGTSTASTSTTSSGTLSASPIVTASPTNSDSSTSTSSVSASGSVSHSPSVTASASNTATTSPTPSSTSSLSEGASVSPTMSASRTSSPSISQTPTSSISESSTPSTTVSSSNTATGTPTSSATQTGSNTRTPSRTSSSSRTSTGTASLTPGASPSSSHSNSPTASTTSTVSETRTPSSSTTSSRTPSNSRTPSTTSTGTVTPGASPSGTPSQTPSNSRTPSTTATSSPTATSTRTASASTTMTPTPTASPSAGALTVPLPSLSSLVTEANLRVIPEFVSKRTAGRRADVLDSERLDPGVISVLRGEISSRISPGSTGFVSGSALSRMLLDALQSDSEWNIQLDSSSSSFDPVDAAILIDPSEKLVLSANVVLLNSSASVLRPWLASSGTLSSAVGSPLVGSASDGQFYLDVDGASALQAAVSTAISSRQGVPLSQRAESFVNALGSVGRVGARVAVLRASWTLLGVPSSPLWASEGISAASLNETLRSLPYSLTDISLADSTFNDEGEFGESIGGLHILRLSSLLHGSRPQGQPDASRTAVSVPLGSLRSGYFYVAVPRVQVSLGWETAAHVLGVATARLSDSTASSVASLSQEASFMGVNLDIPVSSGSIWVPAGRSLFFYTNLPPVPMLEGAGAYVTPLQGAGLITPFTAQSIAFTDDSKQFYPSPASYMAIGLSMPLSARHSMFALGTRFVGSLPSFTGASDVCSALPVLASSTHPSSGRFADFFSRRLALAEASYGSPLCRLFDTALNHTISSIQPESLGLPLFSSVEVFSRWVNLGVAAAASPLQLLPFDFREISAGQISRNQLSLRVRSSFAGVNIVGSKSVALASFDDGSSTDLEPAYFASNPVAVVSYDIREPSITAFLYYWVDSEGAVGWSTASVTVTPPMSEEESKNVTAVANFAASAMSSLRESADLDSSSMLTAAMQLSSTVSLAMTAVNASDLSPEELAKMKEQSMSIKGDLISWVSESSSSILNASTSGNTPVDDGTLFAAFGALSAVTAEPSELSPAASASVLNTVEALVLSAASVPEGVTVSVLPPSVGSAMLSTLVNVMTATSLNGNSTDPSSNSSTAVEAARVGTLMTGLAASLVRGLPEDSEEALVVSLSSIAAPYVDPNSGLSVCPPSIALTVASFSASGETESGSVPMDMTEPVPPCIEAEDDNGRRMLTRLSPSFSSHEARSRNLLSSFPRGGYHTFHSRSYKKGLPETFRKNSSGRMLQSDHESAAPSVSIPLVRVRTALGSLASRASIQMTQYGMSPHPETAGLGDLIYSESVSNRRMLQTDPVLEALYNMGLGSSAENDGQPLGDLEPTRGLDSLTLSVNLLSASGQALTVDGGAQSSAAKRRALAGMSHRRLASSGVADPSEVFENPILISIPLLPDALTSDDAGRTVEVTCPSPEFLPSLSTEHIAAAVSSFPSRFFYSNDTDTLYTTSVELDNQGVALFVLPNAVSISRIASVAYAAPIDKSIQLSQNADVMTSITQSGGFGAAVAENGPEPPFKSFCGRTIVSDALNSGVPPTLYSLGADITAGDELKEALGADQAVAVEVAYVLNFDCGESFPTQKFVCGPGFYGQVIHFSCPLVRRLPTCLFWDEVDNKWSGEGCVVASASEDSITCACDHLTDFSARFSAVGQQQKDLFSIASMMSNSCIFSYYPYIFQVIIAIVVVIVVCDIIARVFDLHGDRKFVKSLIQDEEVQFLKFLADTENALLLESASDLKQQSQRVPTPFFVDRLESVPTVFRSLRLPCSRPKKVSFVPEAFERKQGIAIQEAPSADKLSVKNTVASSIPDSATSKSLLIRRSELLNRFSTAGASETDIHHAVSDALALESMSTQASDSQQSPRKGTVANLGSAVYMLMARQYEPFVVSPSSLYDLSEPSRTTPTASVADVDPASIRSENAEDISDDVTNPAITDATPAVDQSPSSKSQADPEDANSSSHLLDSLSSLPELSTFSPKRLWQLKFFILRMWTLRSLYDNVFLSMFLKYDPYVTREHRLLAFIVLMLTNLWANAFMFGYSNGYDTDLSQMTWVEVFVGAAIATVLQLPISKGLAKCLRAASLSEWRWRFPLISSELRRRKQVAISLKSTSLLTLATRRDALNRRLLVLTKQKEANARRFFGDSSVETADVLRVVAAKAKSKFVETPSEASEATRFGWIDPPESLQKYCGTVLKWCGRHSSQRSAFVASNVVKETAKRERMDMQQEAKAKRLAKRFLRRRLRILAESSIISSTTPLDSSVSYTGAPAYSQQSIGTLVSSYEPLESAHGAGVGLSDVTPTFELSSTLSTAPIDYEEEFVHDEDDASSVESDDSDEEDVEEAEGLGEEESSLLDEMFDELAESTELGEQAYIVFQYAVFYVFGNLNAVKQWFRGKLASDNEASDELKPKKVASRPSVEAAQDERLATREVVRAALKSRISDPELLRVMKDAMTSEEADALYKTNSEVLEETDDVLRSLGCPCTVWSALLLSAVCAWLGFVLFYVLLFGIWQPQEVVEEFLLAWIISLATNILVIHPLMTLVGLLWTLVVWPSWHPFLAWIPCLSRLLGSGARSMASGGVSGKVLAGRFEDTTILRAAGAASSLSPDFAVLALAASGTVSALVNSINKLVKRKSPDSNTEDLNTESEEESKMRQSLVLQVYILERIVSAYSRSKGISSSSSSISEVSSVPILSTFPAEVSSSGSVENNVDSPSPAEDQILSSMSGNALQSVMDEVTVATSKDD